jgi:CheY-like chemotaxis protein
LRPVHTQQRKPGILVVDDEPAVRALLQIALRQDGFAVWLAANGREAVQLYQRHRREIALVLLDVRMPGLDGPRTLAALQALCPMVVGCFMTGAAGDYTEVDLLQQGAVRVFPKPFALGELRAALRQLATPRHCPKT